jgi:hypothetical protein
MNRIHGTALGSIFGIALLEWAGVRGGLPLIVALAAWVFACR